MSLASRPIYNALIRRCIDLQRFCHQAAQQVSEPGLRVVLQENSATLELLVRDMQTQFASLGGRPATHGRWNGSLQRRLATWWIRSTPLRDNQWIRMLSRREAALLHSFEDAMAMAPPDTALALRRLLPQLQGVHLDMHSLGTAAR